MPKNRPRLAERTSRKESARFTGEVDRLVEGFRRWIETNLNNTPDLDRQLAVLQVAAAATSSDVLDEVLAKGVNGVRRSFASRLRSFPDQAASLPKGSSLVLQDGVGSIRRHRVFGKVFTDWIGTLTFREHGILVVFGEYPLGKELSLDELAEQSGNSEANVRNMIYTNPRLFSGSPFRLIVQKKHRDKSKREKRFFTLAYVKETAKF